MVILLAIIIVDLLLLIGTVWAATRKSAPRLKLVIARGADDTPHAL